MANSRDKGTRPGATTKAGPKSGGYRGKKTKAPTRPGESWIEGRKADAAARKTDAAVERKAAEAQAKLIWRQEVAALASEAVNENTRPVVKDCVTAILSHFVSLTDEQTEVKVPCVMNDGSPLLDSKGEQLYKIEHKRVQAAINAAGLSLEAEKGQAWMDDNIVAFEKATSVAKAVISVGREQHRKMLAAAKKTEKADETVAG